MPTLEKNGFGSGHHPIALPHRALGHLHLVGEGLDFRRGSDCSLVGLRLQLGWALATMSPFDGVVSHHTTREPPTLTWPTLWSSEGPREVGS